MGQFAARIGENGRMRRIAATPYGEIIDGKRIVIDYLVTHVRLTTG